ncbi:NAD(P)-dependent oxidoreductase [Plantibacter sp. ME-Dv--P-122b]|uniref:NAD-dependent epimerase/dehydratase family protein n=1 Tax=Plantibacter sp. ME-Dv--P-122b TaxID=3040300 RepID=UPI00254FA13B|nr:NAD(P)-dependent oxidoreductase [Plantibacter sp. ME-Dv--P-122b]
MARVLVTGSSGRLGRSVVQALVDAGSEVVAVDSATSPGSPAASTERVDLTDIGSCYAVIAKHRPDAVVHLAAIAVPFSAPEHVILRTNTLLAFNVVRAAVDLGTTRIVTASSPTVIGYGSPAGWTPERLPLDERVTPKPWNAYALSKLFAEQLTASVAAERGDDIAVAAFRPCYVISPEEWRGALTQQGHTVHERIARPELAAPSLFNYLDARDAGAFVVRLLEAMGGVENAQSYFVGASDALAERPLAELLPEFFPATTGLAAELTGDRPAFSIGKAERLLGWRPTHRWRTELTSSTPLLDRLETV